MTEPHRDIMAPDTEPTDEELAVVMREVATDARDSHIAALTSLRRAVREALAKRLAPVSAEAR